jgi:hypothetical protein
MYRTLGELDFLEFSNTHFVMMFIVLKWLLKVHKSSKQMVVLNAWSKQNDFDTQKLTSLKIMFFFIFLEECTKKN